MLDVHFSAPEELWDDLATASSASILDLADFAAATLKFHSETQEMFGGTAKPVQEEDPMDALIREARDDDLSLDFEQLLEEDESPEWDEVQDAPQATISNMIPANQLQTFSQVF